METRLKEMETWRKEWVDKSLSEGKTTNQKIKELKEKATELDKES